MDEKYMSSVFKEWIKNHETKDYQIIENNQDCIELNTDYGKAEIHFTDVTEGTIVEFNIVSYKDQEVKFYLHFELNDEDHAHQLYDEMVETLIELKNKKTYLTLNNIGHYPKTTDWKSSNSKIASVSTKESSKGVHKVTYKKKGTVTISCKAANSTGKVVKGDVYKWVITIK
jgi:hypothetical protein